jgi:uncharacterized membrane protein
MQREINSERFWQQIGAVTLLLVLVIYGMPIAVTVAWYANDTPHVEKSQMETLQTLTPSLLKVIANTVIVVIVMMLWLCFMLITFEPCMKAVRIWVVKDEIRMRLKKERTISKDEEEIRELKEWIKKQGFTFKGEKQDAT